jgi:hypothetical protein
MPLTTAREQKSTLNRAENATKRAYRFAGSQAAAGVGWIQADGRIKAEMAAQC